MSEPVVVTFTEDVVAGVSTIHCLLCGEKVTAELAHVRSHQPKQGA